MAEKKVYREHWEKMEEILNLKQSFTPWDETCKKLNHGEMIHITRAQITCKMHSPVFLFPEPDSEFMRFHMVSNFYII